MDKTPEVSVRSTRARRAILVAYRDMILTDKPKRISVKGVALRAGVGRSTFYEHFTGIDDVLSESLRLPLAPLASLASTAPDIPLAVATLKHFAQAARSRDAAFRETGSIAVRNCLAEMLGGERRAHAIAGAFMAVIDSWIALDARENEAQIAESLLSIARALSPSAKSGAPPRR